MQKWPHISKSFIQRADFNLLKSLATPAGFEPATLSLEGAWFSNDFKVNSDIFAFCALIDAICEFPFVGMISCFPSRAARDVCTCRR